MRRAVIFLVLIAAAAGGIWWLGHRPPTTPPGQTGGGRAARGGNTVVPVLVAQAAKRDVPVYLDGLGTVQAFNSVTVHSMIDGPLTEVRFTEGQMVHPGDVLALIDPRPYQAALDQATAKKAQDEATLANARLDLVRYNKLVAQNFTSAQQADTQRATVAQTEALVRQDQAQIDTARTNLSYTTVTAPLAGRTGIRQVDSGNIVHTSDASGLVVITQLQPISVVFTLPQQYLASVAAAMAAGPAQVLALPQGDLADGNSQATGQVPGQSDAAPGETMPDPTDQATRPLPVLDRGVVAVLDNQVDSSTGTIKLKATFPNGQQLLWPGGFVNVRLLVRTLPQVVTAPPVSVQRGPTGEFVYVVTNGTDIRRQAVTLGHQDAELAVVTNGLQAGDVVVVDGASRLQDGSKVTISQPPEAAPAAPPRRRPVAPGAAPNAAPAQSPAGKPRATPANEQSGGPATPARVTGAL
jgi:multidrug efflux system membrane fusion protein